MLNVVSACYWQRCVRVCVCERVAAGEARPLTHTTRPLPPGWLVPCCLSTSTRHRGWGGEGGGGGAPTASDAAQKHLPHFEHIAPRNLAVT